MKAEDGPVDESDDVDEVESRRVSLDADCLVHWAEATHIVDKGTFSVYRPRPTCAKGTPVEQGKSSHGEAL